MPLVFEKGCFSLTKANVRPTEKTTLFVQSVYRIELNLGAGCTKPGYISYPLDSE